ncbi:MAG TPA: carbohydrate kinase [Verrucomicrobiae bacterium]|nr:carbohydrate kinase [Verrucomicrobiae bacterium]
MSFKVIGIGEVLWDLLPGGKQIGGALANYTYHAQTLGAEACLVSSVGNDPLGCEILERLSEMQVSVEGVVINTLAPTGTVAVMISPDGQPKFTIRENVAWDQIKATDFTRSVVAQADAVCFGSLAQRNEVSRAAIRSLVASTRPEALRIFDVNLRQNYFSKEIIESSLRLANILKINDEELPVLAGFFSLYGEPADQVAELARRFELQLVALTRGARGSLLYSRARYSEAKSLPVSVVDTVGAGDSFTAVLTMGLLAGWDLDRINRCANEVAAYVVSQSGATPRLPDHLRLLEVFSLNGMR